MGHVWHRPVLSMDSHDDLVRVVVATETERPCRELELKAPEPSRCQLVTRDPSEAPALHTVWRR